MKTLKNQKGITLVALVITIIVLLILAGVSLSLVMGDNGILGRASSTAKEQREAEVKEKVTLELVNLEAEFYQYKYSSNTTENAKVTSYTSSTAAADYAIDKLDTSKISGATVTYTSSTKTISFSNGVETVNFVISAGDNGSFVFTKQGS